MFVCHHIAQIENQRLMYNNWVVLGDALIVKPKSAISVIMITAYIFEQMYLRFEGAMGFHCYR